MSEIEALKKSLEFLEGADKEEMQLRISEMEKAANAQARNTSIEPKPREEEKKVKKSIFGSAKTEQKTKKAKDKVVVEVDGLEKKLMQIDTLKAQIDDLKSQLVGITDEVKDISVEKFAKLFKEQQANPNSFIIRSGDGCVMVVPSDKYIKIDSADMERVNYLRSKYGKSIVTEDEKFYLNPKVFERNREAIEELIGNSNMITEDDKENLFIRQIEYGIAKGSIDRLLQLGTNMQQAISDLQPIFSLKNCGGGEAEQGGELEVVQGSWRVLFSGGGAIPEPDDNYENIKTGYSLCCVAPLYNFSEKCPHCKKECSVITEQEAMAEMAENANEMYAAGGGLGNYDTNERVKLAEILLRKSDGYMSPNESANLAKNYNWTKIEHGPDLEAAAEEIIAYWKEEREQKKNNPTLKSVVAAINKGTLKILRGGEKMFGKLKLSITELVWARNFEDGFNIDVYENGRHLGAIKLTASTDWKPVILV